MVTKGLGRGARQALGAGGGAQALGAQGAGARHGARRAGARLGTLGAQQGRAGA